MPILATLPEFLLSKYLLITLQNRMTLFVLNFIKKVDDLILKVPQCKKEAPYPQEKNSIIWIFKIE